MTGKDFLSIMEDKFQEEFDKIFISYGNEDEVISAIPTESISLDASIGIGGIPRRRYTVIDGPPSSGKSTIALCIARSAIKQGLKVLYIDVENQMDFEYIDLLLGKGHIGTDFILTKPNTSDDAFQIAEAGVKSSEFALIILDSVGSLAPRVEKEKDFTDANIALTPREMTKFLRRVSYDLRVNNIAFVFINQVRADIGSYVKSYSTPGGYALKHYASVIVSLTKGQEIKKGEETIGINAKFTVKKNKLSVPYRSYFVPIIFGVGIDSFRDMISFGEMLGIIRKKGPYYTFEDKTLGSGMVKTMEYLSENKDLLDKIREKVYNTINNKFAGKDIVSEETEQTVEDDNS